MSTWAGSLAGRRKSFVMLAFGTIVVGLAVHLFGAALNPAARDITGDILWAIMMYWLLGAVFPRIAIAGRSVMTYAVCAGVELSQLFHAPSLDALRATTPGHLVLGSGFDSRDLVAYAAGVLIACIAEMCVPYVRPS
ncbi:MAG TPA: DUF2809 domain-containing protein [Gemmatimonadaceae bacterium]|nr:DUF2809 domain-containing protein [Gemmatimonadaceae bacterium]